VWEAEGGADERAGGCISLQSPLVSLPPRRPPPHGGYSRDPCQVPEHGWTDGRATFAAALADRRRSTAHEDDAAAVYYEQFHAVTK